MKKNGLVKFEVGVGEKSFIEALRLLSKKFRGVDDVVISVRVGKSGVELVGCCDLEGNMLFDGETDIRKNKPSYLG